MTVTAIIAEYNPFHNGHAYQLQEARRITGADFLLVVMSGNFVQRGEPAVIDKFARAQMAVCGGADLVLELPVCYSCASAEYFAGAAIALLNSLGCVDYLCFGSECGDLSVLSRIADILAEEPESYRSVLQEAMKSGASFPKARETALCRILEQDGPQKSSGISDYSFHALLSSPNNILGIEYLKALKKTGSVIKPVTVMRIGNSYHDLSLSDSFSSASSLRSALQRRSSVPGSVFACVPEETADILQREYSHIFPVFADDFSPILQYRLLSADSWKDLSRCFGVSEALARRIFELRYRFVGFESFVALVCTRNLTEAHVRRALLHILLDIRADLPGLPDCRSYYARILGLRRSAQPLLSAVKKSGHLPLVSKLADARRLLSSYEMFCAQERMDALAFYTSDLHASELYQIAPTTAFHTPAVSECERPIFILP